MAKGTINNCIFIGRLGKDPEIHRTQNGNTIASFSIATNDRDKDKQDITDWHNIKAFGNTAETIEKYVTKGTKLYLECKHKTNKWKDKDGMDRYSSEFLVRSMQFLSDGKEKQGSKSDPCHQQEYNQSQSPSPVNNYYGKAKGGKPSQNIPTAEQLNEFKDDQIPF
jgi:single-strand DNA-binding protein